MHLSFNSDFVIINGIPSDLQNLLRNFNGTETVMFLKFSFSLWASVFPNNLALHSYAYFQYYY